MSVLFIFTSYEIMLFSAHLHTHIVGGSAVEVGLIDGSQILVVDNMSSDY